MEIIDAQIHDVKPTTLWGTGLDEEQTLEASAELAVTAMDAVGVSAAVVSSSLPIVSAYCTRHPGRFAGLPFLSTVAHRDNLDDYCAGLRATPGLVGVRILFAPEKELAVIDQLRQSAPELADLQALSAEALAGGGCTPYFAAAERHGLPVFVLAHGLLAALHPVLEAHPDLVVILDHLGLPTPPRTPAGPELFDDVPAVLELARYPNVAVKLTGAPSLSMQPYPFADLWPRLRPILEAFGTDRLMWGSDFTRCRGLHTYRESVDFLLHTDELSRTDKEQLFAGTIRKWLGWPA